MQLRDYQAQAVDGIFEAWETNQAALAVLATGLGKTVIASHVVERMRRNGRVLFLAHREELVFQAREKIQAVCGVAPGIEMADYRAETSLWDRPAVIVSTVQTQYSGNGGEGRMARFAPDQFSLLVVDEAHHYAADSYRRVIDYYRQNPALKVLGITATPDRADEAALGQIFDAVAFEYGIMEGIDGGWLVPIEQQSVTVEHLDLSATRTTAGDLNGADLAEAMEYERVLHEVASPSIDIAGNRKTLVFCASVNHAERLAEIFSRHRPGRAAVVTGTTPKEQRRQIFSDYAAGRIQYLCNVGVATEGFDDPGVEVVVMARPTKSRSLYTQMIGRATRPLPGVVAGSGDAAWRREAIACSHKPSALVIDLVGNSGKHKLISVADVLGGNYDDAAVSRAAKKAQDAGEAVDMRKALDEAMAELHAEREEQKRRDAARRAGIKGKATYTRASIDPFDVFQITPRREMGWDVGKTITEKQAALLERQGIDPSTLSYTQARQLLNELFRRWNTNECSYKQARILAKHGLPTNATRDQAKEWIDAIAANGWRLPAQLQSSQREVEVF